MKELHFIDSARTDLAAFPEAARREAGSELWQVQLGFMPSDWKSMPSIGAGAMEIRIHVGGAWRVIYVAKFKDVVHVLHAFQKKTQKTSPADRVGRTPLPQNWRITDDYKILRQCFS